MDNRKIENMLKKAVVQDTPDVWNKIVEKINSGYTVTEVIHAKRKRISLFRIASIAAVFILVFTLGFSNYHYNNIAVAAVIDLDVNPSIEIEVNNKEKVLNVHALNSEADDVLDGLKVISMSFKDAVREILISMKDKGFLENEEMPILFSVNNSKSYSMDTNRMTSDIYEEIKKLDMNGYVMTQVVNNYDEETIKLAKKHRVSEGKIEFVKKINEIHPNLTIDELLDLSINDLNLLFDPSAIKDTIYKEGKTQTGGTIGYMDAQIAALEDVGLKFDDVSKITAVFKVYDKKLIYLVSFEVDGFSYQYMIDVRSGEVINFESIFGGKRED